MDTTYIFLQHYWWFIIALLGGLLVFLLFVQGGQTLMYTVAKTPDERTMVINVLGRKWEFTFTTLVTFGGAFFASFPLFYSTSFGGAYWVWLAILFFFVIQAVSYEFRTKAGNLLGQKTYETFLLLNGLFGTILLGTAVATFFTGSDFYVDTMNITNIGGETTISYWGSSWYGLEAVLNPINVALGLAVFFLARILGALYFMNSVDHEEVVRRSQKQVLYNTIPFLVCFLFFVISILLKDGFAATPSSPSVDPRYSIISMEEYKYLNNFLAMPWVAATFLIGVVLVLFGVLKTIFKPKWTKGIWFAGLGTVLTVVGLLLNVGYHNTSYYPSTADIQSSLTIFNSSSSKFTLTVMSIVSILVPFVLAYIIYAWRAMNKKKITIEEVKGDSHSY